MTRKGLVFYFLIFFLLSACQYYGNWQADLAQNRAKWENQHITHYSFQVDYLDHSSGDYKWTLVVVEVKDEKLVSAVNISTGKTVPLESGLDDFMTIPERFSFINRTYLENPDHMNVIYDPVLGYPTSIDVNRFAEPCCQGFTLTLQNFKVLSP